MSNDFFPEPDEPFPPAGQALAIGILFEGGLGVLALAIGWLFGFSPLRDFSWDPWAFGVGAVAACPMLLMFFAFDRWPVGPLKRIRDILVRILIPMLGASGVGGLFAISLCAGLGEEMLFRGAIQSILTDWWGAEIGLIVSSILFGLGHAVTATYLVIATAIGAYLGWLWTFTGNLLAPITAHALYDFVALVYMVRKERKKLREAEENR